MTTKKKILLGLIMVFFVVICVIVGYPKLFSNSVKDDHVVLPQEMGVRYISKTDKNSLSIYDGEKWNEMFVQGVNIGAGKPGAFPGELVITYDEYYRWFTYISEMNGNTIRVYTTQRPQFYNALFDFNQAAEQAGKDPIYLIHGVWVNENDIMTIEDAFGEDSKIMKDVIKDGQDIVDIIHGDSDLPVNKGYADGTYTTDVSQYVIGWILGIEWDPAFVIGTNDNNAERNKYEGKFLYTIDASPFEAFLAEVGDKIIDYETTKYNMQRPVAFSNWVTTDPLEHPNEPYTNEDLVEVNVEHVKWYDDYKPGMFVSYHVYPYYPDSFSFQPDYIGYKGSDGKPNPYLAYLEDLKTIHSMPIVISEFGIPASRGKAHENRVTGFNQGFIDEETQGKMLVHMINDMYISNLAGGIAFSWQDEWFKRTWNNNDLDVIDSRPYWSNTQTNEQHFGLLAFDPGSPESIVNIDGKVDDWTDISLLYEDNDKKLYVKSDEAYLYLRVDSANYDFNNDTLLIPFNTIDGQGNQQFPEYNTTFSEDADFVLKIHGQTDSRLLVDAYYDNYYFRYAVLTDLIGKNDAFHSKNSGIFNPIRLALNKKLVIPNQNTVIPFTGYETGLLLYGISDPNRSEYNSLSDFYYEDGHLEIRIPWQLLNVMDPSKKVIIDDMYTNGKISPLHVNGFHIGLRLKKSSATEGVQKIDLKEYNWKQWDQPTYHERLKKSYYIVQKGFKDLLEANKE